LLFSVGKLLIGLYLGKSGVASGFGAAGSLVIVLLWVYYSAQIFLLGAEFTKTYAYSHGTRRAQAKPKAQERPRKSAQGADTTDASTGRTDDTAAADDRQAKAPPKGLVPMNVGHPLAGEPPWSRPAFARFRVAAGIAATIGLLAGEIANEIRVRRMSRGGRRG
jgi:membrane protein